MLKSSWLRRLGLKSPGLESSWLNSLWLKGLGLKLGVEKYGFEMSFNPIKVFDYLNRTNCPTDKSMDERPPEEK